MALFQTEHAKRGNSHFHVVKSGFAAWYTDGILIFWFPQSLGTEKNPIDYNLVFSAEKGN